MTIQGGNRRMRIDFTKSLRVQELPFLGSEDEWEEFLASCPETAWCLALIWEIT